MRYLQKIIVIIFTTFFLNACGSNSEVKSTPIMNNNKASIEEKGSDKKECDTGLILKTEQNINKLTQKDILEFLKNINEECKNNAEFMEYYNEVLFKVLEKYPGVLCNCMTLINKAQQKLICVELSKPVNDGINLDNLKKAIENSNCEKDIKSQILNSIDIAIKKYN